MRSNGKRKRNNNNRNNSQRRPFQRNRIGVSGTNGTVAIINSLSKPIYPGQQIRRLRLPGPSQLVTTAGTAFATSYAIGTASSQISDWTDVTASWQEYVILSAHFQIMCLTPPTPGMAFWVLTSNANSAVPIAVEESSDGVVRTNHSMNANRVWSMHFTVRDPSLLTYRLTSVDYDVGYFKGFTNLANFGTTANNTLLYRYTVIYEVLVRGRELS